MHQGDVLPPKPVVRMRGPTDSSMGFMSSSAPNTANTAAEGDA